MRKVIFILMLSSTLLSTAFAGAGKIKRIFVTEGGVYFKLDDVSCVPANKYYFFRTTSTDIGKQSAAKNWYAMLLASAIANKAVVAGPVNAANCNTASSVEVKQVFQDY